MADPDDPAALHTHFPGLVNVARWTTAVLMAAAMATAIWLTIMQEGHAGRLLDHRWTDHDFPDSLGHALGAADPARTGLAATFVLAVAMVLVFAAVERFIPGRDWIKGLVFAPVIFLLWGLLFCPLIDSQQLLVDERFVYRDSGLFALESGKGTLISAGVASICAGVVIARVLQLVRTARWWMPRDPTRQFMVVDRGGGRMIDMPDPRHERVDAEAPGALLELAEQRTDERRERPS